MTFSDAVFLVIIGTVAIGTVVPHMQKHNEEGINEGMRRAEELCIGQQHFYVPHKDGSQGFVTCLVPPMPPAPKGGVMDNSSYKGRIL